MISRRRVPASRHAIALAAAAWVGMTAVPVAHATPDAHQAGAAPLTITVTSGQSLNDLAAAVTQSRDPGVLARAGRALFDANPQAFMKRDPSRLRIGATLTVPSLDATGAAVAQAGSGAAATNAAPVHGASAAASAAHASGASAAAVVQAAAAVIASPGGASAAAAHGASGAAVAASPDTHGSADHAAGGSTPAGVTPTPAAMAGIAAPVAVPAATPSGASGPHVWAGAIQAAPGGANDAGSHVDLAAPIQGATPGGATAPGAEAAQARPSSLQQLLTLKNRVLMELQKHGIGKPAPDQAVVATRDAGAAVKAAAPDAAASGAQPTPEAGASGVSAASAPAQVAGAQAAKPVPASAAPFNTGAAVAVGAAVAALVVGFALRRRRKSGAVDGQDQASPASEAASGDAAPPASTAAASTAAASTAAASTAAASTAPASTAPASIAVVGGAVAAATAADAASHDDERPVAPADASPAFHHDDDGVEVPTSQSEPDDASATVSEPRDAEAHARTDADASPTLVWDDEPRTAPATSDTPVPHAPAPVVPHLADTDFPSDAIAALDSLDMLPPRTTMDGEAGLDASQPSADIDATNGLSRLAPSNEGRITFGSPVDLTAMQDDDELPPLDEADDADADHASPSDVPPLKLTPSPAPLGGAQFGALNLDFDLDLPASPSAALPALSPETLAKIAHNKLDLASEYVELGDLAGARTLLQEVVDAGHAGTADEARARLAKLAELS
jgi:pilus assembly protein FimV